jgi:hypothetical protein
VATDTSCGLWRPVRLAVPFIRRNWLTCNREICARRPYSSATWLNWPRRAVRPGFCDVSESSAALSRSGTDRKNSKSQTGGSVVMAWVSRPTGAKVNHKRSGSCYPNPGLADLLPPPVFINALNRRPGLLLKWPAPRCGSRKLSHGEVVQHHDPASLDAPRFPRAQTFAHPRPSPGSGLMPSRHRFFPGNEYPKANPTISPSIMAMTKSFPFSVAALSVRSRKEFVLTPGSTLYASA